MTAPASPSHFDSKNAASYDERWALLAPLCETYGREVAVLPEPELEALLVDAGFVPPVRFCQSLLIHAWFARRS